MAHEQVGIEGGYMGAHGYAFNVEILMGVQGEVVVGEGKLSELDKELSGCNVWGRGLD